MNKLICKLLGHRWVTRWRPDAESETYSFLTCTRCGEYGYQT